MLQFSLQRAQTHKLDVVTVAPVGDIGFENSTAQLLSLCEGGLASASPNTMASWASVKVCGTPLNFLSFDLLSARQCQQSVDVATFLRLAENCAVRPDHVKISLHGRTNFQVERCKGNVQLCSSRAENCSVCLQTKLCLALAFHINHIVDSLVRSRRETSKPPPPHLSDD